MKHLFPNFLSDATEYAQAEAYWEQLWQRTPGSHRRLAQWRSGWLRLGPFKDGNPIFTAVSDFKRKGIRIIQYEPSSNAPELDFWLDTFGGPTTDPRAIQELVIACSLSAEAAANARSLMSAWLTGPIELVNSSASPHGFTSVISAGRQMEGSGVAASFAGP